MLENERIKIPPPPLNAFLYFFLTIVTLFSCHFSLKSFSFSPCPQGCLVSINGLSGFFYLPRWISKAACHFPPWTGPFGGLFTTVMLPWRWGPLTTHDICPTAVCTVRAQFILFGLSCLSLMFVRIGDTGPCAQFRGGRIGLKNESYFSLNFVSSAKFVKLLFRDNYILFIQKICSRKCGRNFFSPLIYFI